MKRETEEDTKWFANASNNTRYHVNVSRIGTYYIGLAARRGDDATCAADVATLTDPTSDGLTFATPTRDSATFLLLLASTTDANLPHKIDQH